MNGQFDSVIGDVLVWFLFRTGDLLWWAVSLGQHRIHWWDAFDPDITWPPVMAGFLFWCAVGWLVWVLAF